MYTCSVKRRTAQWKVKVSITRYNILESTSNKGEGVWAST